MSRKTLIRVIVLLVVSLVLMYIGRHTGFSRYFSLDYLSDAMVESGYWGILLFTLFYTVGTLMNVPGVIFLFIAFMVYDRFNGIAVGYSASLIAMVVHFGFTRALAGKALSEIKQPFIRKQLDKLEDYPIRTTIVLRAILFISPPVNYALALSDIRFRDFFIGSMLALPFNIMLNYCLMVYGKNFIMHFWM